MRVTRTTIGFHHYLLRDGSEDRLMSAARHLSGIIIWRVVVDLALFLSPHPFEARVAFQWLQWFVSSTV